jgi:serine/threonine-protein phosphatase 5
MASTLAADKAAATALKVKGNEAFAGHDWPSAVDFYTKAIEKYDSDPSFYCNRAQANIKLEAFGYAVADATKAIQLDKDYIKVISIQMRQSAPNLTLYS